MTLQTGNLWQTVNTNPILNSRDTNRLTRSWLAFCFFKLVSFVLLTSGRAAVIVSLTLLLGAVFSIPPTKTRGVINVCMHIDPNCTDPGFLGVLSNASATIPFVVGIDEYEATPSRRYYFWFFGYVAKLPYEREI